MQTREEAVLWLQEHGLFAKPRNWSFGESISVWSSQETAPGGITVCHDLVCIHRQADQWCLSDLSAGIRHTKLCGTPAQAVTAAVEHFRAKSGAGSLPINEGRPSPSSHRSEHPTATSARAATIVDLLAMRSVERPDFEARKADGLYRPPDLA